MNFASRINLKCTRGIQGLSYHRPTELADALEWLDENLPNNARVAAGCTDLFPATAQTRLDGPILDITAIDDLRGIQQRQDTWRFGATTTWSDIIKADLPPAFDGLKLAAKEVGSIQIQNSGTIGGNICNASPAADGSPCWLTLNASIELASKAGTREIPLADFMLGPRQTALTPGEIVSAINVRKENAAGSSHFLKLGARPKRER